MVAFGNVALELDNSTVSDNPAAADPYRRDHHEPRATPTRSPATIRPGRRSRSFRPSWPTTAAPEATLRRMLLDPVHDQRHQFADREDLLRRELRHDFRAGHRQPHLGRCDPGPIRCSARSRTTAARRARTRCSAGSPAINAGSNPLALTTDQRGAGFPRVVGGAADMGAYESGTAIPLANFAYLSQFGTPGTRNGQFSTPFGVAIDPTSHNIVVVDAVAQSRADIQFRGRVSEPVRHPRHRQRAVRCPDSASRSTRPAHNIVVADSGNNRVQIFNAAGVYPEPVRHARHRQRAVQSARTASRSTRPATTSWWPTRQRSRADFQFRGCVSEPVRHRRLRRRAVPTRRALRSTRPATTSLWPTPATIACRIFDPDGAYLGQFGTAGTGNGQFIDPRGIAIDPTSHNIVVADYGNNRVQIFSSAGDYLSQFGSLGSGNGQFNNPVRRCDRPDQPQHRCDRLQQQSRADFRAAVGYPGPQFGPQ